MASLPWTLAIAAALRLPLLAPAAPPVSPLPSLPVITRVRVEVARDHVVVTTDLRLTRGEHQRGDVAFYMAFGAPGAPQAAEAQLLSLPEDVIEAPLDATSEALKLDRASSRPPSVPAALGRGHVAGLVVRVPAAQFQRATAEGHAAVVRVRTLGAMPAADASGDRELIVRLGDALGQPITLGAVEVVAAPALGGRLSRASARLCAPKNEARLLAVRGQPLAIGAVAPFLAQRLSGDDLCITFASP